jgi:LuxR family transcriptional regulator
LLKSLDVIRIAPVGHYLAIRVGFAFPVVEVNELPPSWVEHYTLHGFLAADPAMQWVHSNVGFTRWSEISSPDPKGVLAAARRFGINYGASVSWLEKSACPQRSFGLFLRSDREFTDQEMSLLWGYVVDRHEAHSPPRKLTMAEIEVLRLVKEGRLIKQIAFDLGVGEGAIKQRLRAARAKLDAKTGAEAISRAVAFGII